MASRDEILDAIRLTAKDGHPLGSQAFAKETGIKQSDWYCKYWVRWSDAIKEAGFAPNTFNQRIDKSIMLEKLIPAIRHFGKFPTFGELRLYHKVDSTFPSHSTVLNHFPTKKDLITEVTAYISDKPELEDIAGLCRNFGNPQKDSSSRSTVTEGHVYLFKSGNHYKIGKTSNLERRVKEVTVALPEFLTIIHTIRTDDPDGIEAYWHRRFSDRRANGEWFKLNIADVNAFKRRKFQ